ncbi:Agamous-like MADS-box protein AGL17 [Capsicum baccatum]|uniref:Agamous-like MADS-box protein AGL17 n=1 Tax=Capsicum baccatum TaxID=33114 RepID=A0A2G2WD83_CAPBA|nr:Agamous-like MADS-box protein AGL17 [Capsicum baccatum]
MGRNKRVMEKIEDPTSRQQTYSKLKDRFVKKADELAILCDTDVALLMFSPTDQVTSYSSRGSVEDIMLRVVNRYGNPYRQYYEPQVEKISSVQEADACQKFLMSAMEQIQRSKVASVNPEDASYAAGNGSAFKFIIVEIGYINPDFFI